MSDTAARVLRTIKHNADLAEPPDAGAALHEVLFDALGRIELVISIEEEFALEISDEQAERWSTVADVIAFVEARR